MKIFLKYIVASIVLSFVTMSGRAQQRVVFTPQWTPQAQFAGYYAAQELGFYTEAGLDVEIKHPTSSMYALNMLKSGESDIITSMLIDAIACMDSGQDIINIMQLMPHSTMMIISHQPLNGDAESLRGKRVAMWRAGFSTIIIAILLEKGVDIELVKFLSGVNVFLSESVDATIAMSYNELQTITETGFEIPPTHILRLSDMGYNIPEDGLYTTSAFNRKNPDVVKKFREASLRGWQWVAENRDEAVAIVLKLAAQSSIPTNKYHQTKMLDNLLSEGIVIGDDVTFDLQKEDFEQTRALLYRSGLITNQLSFDKFIGGASK